MNLDEIIRRTNRDGQHTVHDYRTQTLGHACTVNRRIHDGHYNVTGFGPILGPRPSIGDYVIMPGSTGGLFCGRIETLDLRMNPDDMWFATISKQPDPPWMKDPE
ncbi:hypothetical protein [Streptomyces aidingensis]|uniref:Uncharacterized protein n=1 Tax=Streptomyces aidingensis TaxID=910347 RepID=A0A1I1Q2K2_9ACTN|nr:hypothetical protein [Streptomyces aidingensis]SFD14078.1 hypothetical protein SAMN05421773_11093 [Streptomyces aidingensis]